MKNKKLLLTLGIILLVLILSGGIYLYIKSKASTKQQNIDRNNFSLTYEYVSNNTWNYTVTGTLPTPCYSAQVQAVVMESYPEQVSIKVTPTEDTTVDMCATVTKDFTYDGTFNASSLAKISLDIEE